MKAMILSSGAGVKMKINMFEKAAPDFMGVVNSVSPQPNAYVPIPQYAPGVVPVTLPAPKVYDAVRKVPVSSPELITVNRTPVDGDFEWTVEGGLKPFLKFGYSTESVQARKLPARTKTSKEALADIDWIQSDTENMLKDEFLRKLSSEILNGDGTKNASDPVNNDFRILGLKYFAPTYIQTCMDGRVQTPELSEVLFAAATQIKNLGFEGSLTAFVNPCDWAVEVLRKNTLGELLDIKRLLEQINVIPTSEMALDEFFIGDLSMYTLYVREEFNITYGYENDDFSRNLVSVLGEGRVFGFTSQNNVGAFCADSINAVKTLIAK
jgi:hypothetical protein